MQMNIAFFRHEHLDEIQNQIRSHHINWIVGTDASVFQPFCSEEFGMQSPQSSSLSPVKVIIYSGNSFNRIFHCLRQTSNKRYCPQTSSLSALHINSRSSRRKCLYPSRFQNCIFTFTSPIYVIGSPTVARARTRFNFHLKVWGIPPIYCHLTVCRRLLPSVNASSKFLLPEFKTVRNFETGIGDPSLRGAGAIPTSCSKRSIHFSSEASNMVALILSKAPNVFSLPLQLKRFR